MRVFISFFIILIFILGCSKKVIKDNDYTQRLDTTQISGFYLKNSILLDTAVFEFIKSPYDGYFYLNEIYKNIRYFNKIGLYNKAIETSQSFFDKYFEILQVEDTLYFDYQMFKSLYSNVIKEYNYAITRIDTIDDNLYFSNFYNLIYDSDSSLVNRYKTLLKPYKGDIPLPLNYQVLNMIYFFDTKGKRVIRKWISRKPKYEKIIRAILLEYNIPEEFVYLPMIESGYSPFARSTKGAVGLWQFMPKTARLNGLLINYWVDERRDYVKSTIAAAKHLSYLYSKLGDWFLVLAAYNWGYYGVRRLINKYKTNNIWELYYFLPKETRLYVSSFVAVILIDHNKEVLGLDSISYQNPIDYTTVEVEGGLLVSYLGRLIGLSYKEMRDYNPELLVNSTPPTDKIYFLKIPKDKKEEFIEKYKNSPKKEKILIVKHRIKRGDSIYKLARIYHTTVKAIIEANKLKNISLIREGDYLIIPVPASAIRR